MSKIDYQARKYSATARVLVTVEVDLSGGNWGGECTIAQVHRQAADQARSIIWSLAKEGLRIYGEPQVTAVLCPPKRDT